MAGSGLDPDSDWGRLGWLERVAPVRAQPMGGLGVGWVLCPTFRTGSRSDRPQEITAVAL